MAATTSTAATPSTFDIVAARFPLVPRSRPSCPPLDARIAHVAALAGQAAGGGGDALLRAAEAHNLAALIASDCGLPDLARSLCWRQIDTLPLRRPLDGATAKLALQPFINLARLRLRAGDGLAAYQMLTTLYDVVVARTSTAIDERALVFDDLVTDVDHPQTVRWLWTVLLADGTRALTRTGHWTEALDHLNRHKGIGQRLLDGRQTAILAHHAHRDHYAAEHLLTTTATTQPWEQSVATCLGLLHRHLTGLKTPDDGRSTIDALLPSNNPEHLTFNIQLGLCLLDLADTPQHLRPVLDTIIDGALHSDDAYAARDLLTHPAARGYLNRDQLTLLNERQRHSGLGSGRIPEALRTRLLGALALAS
ncbi:conserved hypothetical protein [Parafrankia sp. EAN1pec]|uniref:hypothetical protein n=1 Tax=Parafrankia sp. (strain EAN1pec) TaxID=298653 RepID=UPI000054064F|nr:conserved hypothetical protein [Frankia sp. EAN1pec]